MLQLMHEKLQGWVAGIIATVIALTFALWNIQNYLHGGGNAQLVAKVNGEKITRAELNVAYEQLKRTEMLMKGSTFSLDQKAQAELKKTVLQQLVNKEIISQAIKKIGLTVGQEQIWASVMGLPIFQVNGHFSPEYFRQVAERLFVSEQSFLDNIKLSILQNQLMEGIAGSAFILPNEIEDIKKLLKQQRDFGYFTISPKQFANSVQITPSDIKNYYDNHHGEFTIPEKVSIEYIELASSDIHTKVKASEEQLKQYYQAHLSSYTSPKKWQITKVLLPLPLTADTKITSAAKKKLSEIKASDDLSKITGAQVTKIWVNRNEAGTELAAQLDKLKVGQISQPIRSKDGYFVANVLAIQPESVSPYKTVASKVKQAFERQESLQAFSEASDKLTDLTYTNPDSLELAAKELHLKIKTEGPVTSIGSKTGILANNKILSATFGDAVLKQRYNSNPIEIAPGKLIVLRVKEYIPETLEPLAKVQPGIVEKLKNEAMQKKANDLSQELLNNLRKGVSFAELGKQFNLVWHVVNNATRDGYSRVDQLVEEAFNLVKPNPKEVSASVLKLSNGDYAVLQLLKVSDGKEHKEKMTEIEALKSLPEKMGYFEYQIFIKNLTNKAKIKYYEEAEDKN